MKRLRCTTELIVLAVAVGASEANSARDIPDVWWPWKRLRGAKGLERMDGGERNLERGAAKRMQWPARLLGPRPGLREMNMLCWGLLAGLFIARFLIPMLIQLRSGTGSIVFLPADFIYFYGIGHIANNYPLERVYEYSLQLKTFNEIYALHDGAYGPSPYPPFVALFFSLLARVPFAAAFALWAAISLALYLVGIGDAVRTVFSGERLKASPIFCFALAFYPFAVGTLANGQLAAVAVFATGIAIAQEAKQRMFSSGLALSVLAYKPTLLVLVIPMLLVTRRFRALGGFATGVAMLVLATTAFGGIEVWAAYVRFLSLIGHVAGTAGPAGLPLWKYVDFDSCIHALSGGRGSTVLIAIGCAVVVVLADLLGKSRREGRPAQSLAWAATLTWTLLLNVYVPIYDTVLVTISVVLTLGALKELRRSNEAGWVVALSVAMVAASWVTSAIAEKHGVQVLSILLAVLGVGQLYFLWRSIGASVVRVDALSG